MTKFVNLDVSKSLYVAAEATQIKYTVIMTYDSPEKANSLRMSSPTNFTSEKMLEFYFFICFLLSVNLLYANQLFREEQLLDGKSDESDESDEIDVSDESDVSDKDFTRSQHSIDNEEAIIYQYYLFLTNPFTTNLALTWTVSQHESYNITLSFSEPSPKL